MEQERRQPYDGERPDLSDEEQRAAERVPEIDAAGAS